MRVWWRIGGSLAAAGVLSFALAAAGAETCALEMKRLEPYRGGNRAEEMIYRYVHPQHFFMQIQEGREVGDDQQEKEFSDLVKKEPKEYNSKHPLKRVAQLGSDKFCFVIDAKKPDSKSFDRLYFDLNHNGDLTDDEPIESSPKAVVPFAGPGQFPRVDLTIDADGKKVDYSLVVSAHGYFGDEYQYISASLSAAAYRAGEITLDGEKHRLVLLDFNSNGRFDDVVEIPSGVRMANDGVYAQAGDMLWVDPAPQTGYGYWRVSSGEQQQYVSTLLSVGGKFYDLEITPAGDKLTLTPSELPTGKVSNPNGKFCAVVYNDEGVFLKIHGGKDQPAPLPVGKWKLLEYTIDLTEQMQEETEEAKAEKPTGLLEAIAKAVMGIAEDASSGQPSYTLVAASGKSTYKAVEVRKGKTAKMPFGPPYQPKVTVDYLHDDTAELGLEIVGSAGEVCQDLMVRGKQPSAPEFTIVTKDGEKVTSGSFKYG